MNKGTLACLKRFSLNEDKRELNCNGHGKLVVRSTGNGTAYGLCTFHLSWGALRPHARGRSTLRKLFMRASNPGWRNSVIPRMLEAHWKRLLE